MPAYNEGAKQVEANQQRALNVKSQETLQNERIVEKLNATKDRDKQLSEREKEWAEEEKAVDTRRAETINQREFFTGLQRGLKDGKIEPKDVIGWEAVEERTAEEIGAMDEHAFNTFVERKTLANQLKSQRLQMERTRIGNALANDIARAREDNWEKQVGAMTTEEREEFDRKYVQELNNL